MLLVYLSSVLLFFCTHAKVITDSSNGWINPNYDQEFNSDESEYNETVKVQVYYETQCPGCIYFDTQSLEPTIKKLGKYLDIITYPYGNAKTIVENGNITFDCQHGPDECYGNKLHACALDIIKDKTEAVLFNICMMDANQSDGHSDDRAAVMCSASMKKDSKKIITCAKGEKGTQLLQYYGDESKKAQFDYVPYVLINGKEMDIYKYFFDDVCQAFTNPPPECKNE